MTASQVSETAADDPEICPLVQAFATQILPNKLLGTSCFSRFSQWAALVKAIGRLLSLVRSHCLKAVKKSSTSESLKPITSASFLSRAELLIIQNVKYQAYEEEINCLKNSRRLAKTSPMLKLGPLVCKDGLVRVGGRLEHSILSYEESHPLILPSPHHNTALLITLLYHQKVQHQGQHFTLGVI